MKINGWHRLWVLAVLVWAVVLAGMTLVLGSEIRTGIDGDLVRSMVALWAVASVAMLGIGHAVAWVLRGFERSRQHQS